MLLHDHVEGIQEFVRTDLVLGLEQICEDLVAHVEESRLAPVPQPI